MKRTYYFYLALAALAFEAVAKSAPYLPSSSTLNEKGHEFRLDTSLWNSTHRVDDKGEASAYENAQSFRQLQSDLRLNYGLTNQLEISGGLSFRLLQADYTDGQASNQAQNSGGYRALIGFKYRFVPVDDWSYAAYVNYRPALFANSEPDPADEFSLALGDDGAATEFGAIVNWKLSQSVYLSADIAYRNPSPRLSNEVFTRFEAAKFWKSWAVLAGLESVNSLGQDSYSSAPGEKPPIDSGHSSLYNSVNREWLAPYIGVNYAISENWRVETRYLNRLSGSSTDLGSEVLISLARRVSKSNADESKQAEFKQYRVEARVTKLSRTGTSVVIDAGITQGVNKGELVDFYHFDFLDSEELIASGIVLKAGASKAIVKITKKYAKKSVQEGTVARTGIIR